MLFLAWWGFACCGALLKNLDIAIAGAGPGGLAAALALHGQGHRVVIYDQFDEPRPVGSGLLMQPTGLGVLDWLGQGERLRGLGCRIDRLVGSDASTGRIVLDVRYAALGEDRGYAVHRAALFRVLFDAVKSADIAIETEHKITGFDDGELQFSNGKPSAKFDFVVDALGARSPLRAFSVAATPETELQYGAIWASLPWQGNVFDKHALTQRYHKAAVMIGVLPIGQMIEHGEQQTAFFWSLKTRDYAAWKAGGIDKWKAEVMGFWPETEALLAAIHSPVQMTLARYQHHTQRKPWGRRLIAIGDSAHSTSPQLGQGANNALLDVMALTQALNSHTDFDHVVCDYAHRRRRHVWVYQLLSLGFTPFYQSDSTVLPWLRDHLVANGAKIPVVQRLLARMVAGKFVEPIRAGLHF